MGWSNSQVRDLVVRTLIGEGAHGDPESWASVAHVLKNRADTGSYGDPTVNGLTNTIKAPKQFSMWNPDIASSGKTISPGDPLYQQAGIIADQVFGGQHPDNTGGADHYYAPSGMAGGHAPSWAIGQTPTATIGGQHFFKLGLSDSDAVNQGHTSAGPIVGGGGSSGGGGASGSYAAPPIASVGVAGAGAISRAVADAHALLGKNEVPDHDMLADYLKTGGQNLDPHQSAWCAAFVSASLKREGLPVPGKIVADSQFVGGANARDYLTYGQGVTDPNAVQAGDILVAKDGSHVGFAEGPVRQGANGPEVQILAGNEADRSGKYQPGSWTNPQTGQTASRSQVGQVGERWAPLADFTVRRAPAGAADTGPASSTAPAAAATGVMPASQAQPASATAPGSSGGNFAVPPAGASAGFPGSDKVSLVEGMTTGTSHNPQITTAANWGNLFGGKAATPVASVPTAPAATPAVTPPASATPLPVAPPGSPLEPVKPDLSKDAPIGATGPTMPFLPNPFGSPAFPPAAPPAAKPITLPSLSANWGAATPANPDTLPNTGGVPGGGVTGRAPMTEGAPSMGFPSMTNPFGQTAMLPGSMLASAQDLIRRLFPSSVG
jgi:hypothetical protein